MSFGFDVLIMVIFVLAIENVTALHCKLVMFIYMYKKHLRPQKICELAEKLEVSQKICCNRLHAIITIQKAGIWVPHSLRRRNKDDLNVY